MGRKSFKVLKFLGKGSYGSVYKVQRRSDGKIYAMKELNIKYMSHRERQDAVNEIRLLASVQHANIIAYNESFVEGDKLCIITEYAADGDLYQKIRKTHQARKRFSEDSVWRYFIQICRALAELHAQNILHRDLKSPNVFLATDGTVKLGDLGVAKLMKTSMAYTQIGTPYYLSPEIWRNEAYNEKSDIWSLGVLLYEIVTFRHPFDASSQKALSAKVLRGRYARIPPHYSTDLAKMISRCLNTKPTARPTIDDILSSDAVVSRLHLVEHLDTGTSSSLGSNRSNRGVIDTIRVPRARHNFNRELTKALPSPVYMATSPAKFHIHPSGAKSHRGPVTSREERMAALYGGSGGERGSDGRPVVRRQLIARGRTPERPGARPRNAVDEAVDKYANLPRIAEVAQARDIEPRVLQLPQAKRLGYRDRRPLGAVSSEDNARNIARGGSESDLGKGKGRNSQGRNSQGGRPVPRNVRERLQKVSPRDVRANVLPKLRNGGGGGGGGGAYYPRHGGGAHARAQDAPMYRRHDKGVIRARSRYIR